MGREKKTAGTEVENKLLIPRYLWRKNTPLKGFSKALLTNNGPQSALISDGSSFDKDTSEGHELNLYWAIN